MMEEYLGRVGGRPSRVKNIILRQNGITGRYYALDRDQRITHSNAQMAALAIDGLFEDPAEKSNVEVLTCGTSSPDQNLPSQASMVHGEAFAHPLKYTLSPGVLDWTDRTKNRIYMSIMMGNSKNAVCSMSELVSPSLLAKIL